MLCKILLYFYIINYDQVSSSETHYTVATYLTNKNLAIAICILFALDMKSDGQKAKNSVDWCNN